MVQSTRQLSESSTGVGATVAPQLAYGRHRGPWHGGARRAAVMVGLYQQQDQWMIPLTRRPETLEHHGGQICLPGGRIEQGETPREAAIREFHEELGVAPEVVQDFHQAPGQYVYASDNLVEVFVCHIRQPAPWQPDPKEVAEVIVLPWDVIRDSQHWTTIEILKPVRQNNVVQDSLSFQAPAIEHQNHQVWGATAMILKELAHRLLLG